MVDAVLSVEQQIQLILHGNPQVIEVMKLGFETDAETRSRILTQPLKRTTDTDALLAANDPTPQCFDSVPPYWLKPSVSIASGAPVIGAGTVSGTSARASRYISVRYTLAYYAGPDVADVLLWQMRSACMAALHGEKVVFPDGVGAHLQAVNDLSTAVPVPEFPGAGKVMIERVGAYGVWRRT